MEDDDDVGVDVGVDVEAEFSVTAAAVVVVGDDCNGADVSLSLQSLSFQLSGSKFILFNIVVYLSTYASARDFTNIHTQTHRQTHTNRQVPTFTHALSRRIRDNFHRKFLCRRHSCQCETRLNIRAAKKQ